MVGYITVVPCYLYRSGKHEKCGGNQRHDDLGSLEDARVVQGLTGNTVINERASEASDRKWAS